MLKKIFTVLTLFVLLAVFLIFSLKSKKVEYYKILKVVEADTFYIDINKNNIIDNDELFKIKNIIAFSPDKTFKTDEYSQKLGISTEQYLKVGYLAQAWAKEELTNKNVEILSEFHKLNNGEKYRYVDINYNNSNLAQDLLVNGLAFAYEKSNNSLYFQLQNPKQIKENANELKKLDFVFVNKRTNVAHLFNCEHFSEIKYGEIILKKKIEFLGYKLCKKCIKDKIKYTKFDLPAKSNIFKNSMYGKFGEVEIYLINPLEKNKPDSTCNTAICKRIVKEINNSKTSVDLALYGLNDQNAIVEALRNAKKRGVKINLVSDYSLNIDTIFPYSSIFNKEFDAILDDKITLMHNKFIIFDNQKVMTGSINLTASGTGGYNANSAVVINSSKISEIYKKEFEQMRNGKFSNKKEKVESDYSSNIIPYFSPKNNVYEKGILPLIKNAKSKIYVSAFYFTDRKMINELIEAKNRGVDVLVIMDALGAMNFKDRIVTLRSAGIPVKIENWGGKNHEKTIMVDDESLLIGSCNFTISGFYKNDENFVIIKNSELAKFYEKYFINLFNSIDNKYLKFFPRAEGIDSINSCFDGIDNNFDGKVDFEDDGCKNINKK